MLLAGDIGGTKTTLALYASETILTPQHKITYRSADYNSLAEIAQQFLNEVGRSAEKAAFGVAGPVLDGQVKATNLPWVISEQNLRMALGVQDVKLLNDLEATAYGVPHLPPDELFILNAAPALPGTKAVIAPGTGLGEAVLFYQNDRYQVSPSEGGHADFAPTSLLELELLRDLMGKIGHVSYERVCSGKGIPNIYAFLKHNHFAEETPEVANALREASDPNPIIVQAAMDGEDELSIGTLNMFVSILGAEAGNLALKVMATGGVYLGGGIPPRILPKLKDGTFMASFVNKGRFAERLAQIPVYVILNAETALLGAACYGLEL